MKNAKRIIALLLAALMALALAGCGASKNDTAASAGAYYDAREDYLYDEPAEAEAPMPAAAAEASNGVGGANNSVPDNAPDMSEKIIYNAEVTLETTGFDDALERIAAMVRDMGGYMESTSVSGSNYGAISRGSAGARSAYYTIRIPSARFAEFTGSLTDLGNVPYSRTYTRNVTREYYDTQSRLDAYKVQEKRLLEMLSVAETVEDMLAIQRELTDVQYEIDSLTGTLRYYDNQVGYSTVDLTVREVREYTPEPTITLTYWERMSKGFRESLHDTARFFTEFFLWFVTSLPWLIPLGAVIVVIVVLIRRRTARNPEIAKRRAARKEARALRRAARKARKTGENAGETAEK
jgi:hypothetical protein